MAQTVMRTVQLEGETRQYPDGTRFETIAEEYRSRKNYDILLVKQNGKLCELHKTLDRDCTLELLTAEQKPGMMTYQRSLILLMLKAFYDVTGRGRGNRLVVEHSVGRALFVSSKGPTALSKELMKQVEDRMHQLVEQSVPIVKQSMDRDQAIRLFEERGMKDKMELLNFRLSSHVNIYSIEDFFDYFYGYMVPNTRYLKCFALELFGSGFILRLPDVKMPDRLGEFAPSVKVFDELCATTLRADMLQTSNVGDMNRVIATGGATQMILSQEALMEKQIGDIAETISRKRGVHFVMIAGPSSSGKTTFSHRLSTQLIACGLRPHPIATDNYFKNREDTPRDENGQYNFEGLEAMDVELFNRDMTRLLKGETVEMPQFNFKKGQREYNGDFLTMGPEDVLVIEGIHCLNDALSYSLPKESKYRIYISCLTTLNIDDHNYIPTTDARLLRRIERDARTRGYSAQATLKMWPLVREGEEDNIFPHQDSADIVFNSALIYEIALLKPYVEPLLFGVPRDSDEYIEANRLLKFLSYFMPLPADDVPKTSLLREFIGGGCYKV